jgi:hypothetical protein
VSPVRCVRLARVNMVKCWATGDGEDSSRHLMLYTESKQAVTKAVTPR